MKRWQLQEAMARLGEVVSASCASGPQEITVHGKPVAVVLSRRDYDLLTARKPSFLEFLRRSPLAGVDLRVRRDKSPARDLSF